MISENGDEWLGVVVGESLISWCLNGSFFKPLGTFKMDDLGVLPFSETINFCQKDSIKHH